MMLILEISHADSNGAPDVRKLNEKHITLGRAPDNDIILPDPYVSAHHAVLSLEDGGWVIKDLNSENGTWLHNQNISPGSKIFKAGDSLTVGQTILRRLDLATPVTPALLLRRQHPFVAAIAANSFFVFLAFVLMLSVNLGIFYALRWMEEPGKALSAVAAISAALVLLWSTPWAVAGRLLRGKSDFFLHIFFISVFLMIGTLQTYVQGYIDFWFNENIFAGTADTLLNFILMTGLLYSSLSLASKMTRKRAWFTSAGFSAGILAIVITMTIVSQKNFDPRPDYPAGLQPWPPSLLKAEGVDTFLSNTAKRADKIQLEKEI